LRFPSDIVQPEIAAPLNKRPRGKPSRNAEITDSWGCTWQITESDAALQLKDSPLAEKSKIAEFRPPMELLDPIRFSRVDKSCENSHRFVLARSETRPFDRLRFLRGYDAALMDLARGNKDARNLLKMIHEFFCKEIEMWSNTEVDGVVLRDDWGTAESLIIAPEMWREIFKPLYREYCKILHAKDKFVFFQSKGYIIDIISDLIKEGIDAIHMQLHLMDVEKLAKRFRGRVTFWGEIDPQGVLRCENLAQIREAVLKIRRALDLGSGGVIAQCQWDPNVPVQIIAAVFEQWLLPLPMHA
ncbi:MAG TPA: uroporphyrinogen decarboxylase family protein, partial [Thermoguttaceae bacterium]